MLSAPSQGKVVMAGATVGIQPPLPDHGWSPKWASLAEPKAWEGTDLARGDPRHDWKFHQNPSPPLCLKN